MKSRGLERARMIAGERRAPAAKRWEVVNAKRPSTSGQALRRLSANIAERRRAQSAECQWPRARRAERQAANRRGGEDMRERAAERMRGRSAEMAERKKKYASNWLWRSARERQAPVEARRTERPKRPRTGVAEV